MSPAAMATYHGVPVIVGVQTDGGYLLEWARMLDDEHHSHTKTHDDRDLRNKERKRAQTRWRWVILGHGVVYSREGCAAAAGGDASASELREVCD